jgi:NADH-quinone oxidoreductase subunit C
LRQRDLIVPDESFLRDDAQAASSSAHRHLRRRLSGRAERFDVVYHLLSPRQNQRIRVKVTTDETDAGAVAHALCSRRQLVRARSL